jgi:hypothetical protein
MAKMKSYGAKGYAEGGEMQDDAEDMSEKRSAPRKAPPARPASPRLPAGRREEDFTPRYQGNVKDLLSRTPMTPMTDQSRQRLKAGGMVKADGCATKGRTKGRMV